MISEEVKKAAERYANDVCRGSHHRWGMEQVCMADFMEGWDACLKYLGNIPWDEAVNEIVKHIETNRSEIPNSSNEVEV